MSIRHRVWLLFVLSLLGYVYMVATHDEQSCSRTLWAVDVPRWLDGQVQPVNYEKGDWFDGSGRLIGHSATEDSDVCVKGGK